MLKDNKKRTHFVMVGKGGGGGIDQVQSDWNQTDDTQVDYIKNKPSVSNEWFGTQAEFDLIDPKDANTVYYIEDANGSVVHNNKTYGIKVHIENPELEDLNVTENGTYQSSTKYGYDEVTVNVQPNLETLNATENDTYTPTSPVQGFNRVVVNVPAPQLTTLNTTMNGDFTPSSPYVGYSSVRVEVSPTLQDKTVNQNGTVTADQGYDGLGSVTVNVSNVPTYLTATYFVSNPSNSFKILNSTTNIAGYRIKGASTWETPTTTITASNYGELVIEYDLTDNTTLQGNEFKYCSDLVKIEFPTSITTIGDECFYNTGLIDYPDMTYITTAGDRLFFNCPIKSMGLTINDNVTRNYANGVFNGFDRTDVIDKVYVNGKVYIALFHTENNGDVDLTNGIDGLPFDTWCMYAGHMHYTLNSLKFPSTLQYLSGSAFERCTITDLYFYSTTPPEWIPLETGSTNDIWNGSNITNIYVPAAALSDYQNSSAFANVVSKIQAM